MSDIQAQMEAHLVEVIEDKNALTALTTKMAREITALKTELSKQRKESPKMVDAQEVFDYWVDKLGKTKRTTFGPARQKAVIARLSEKPLSESEDRKDDLFEAVRGMARRPFVGPQGRQADDSNGAKKHDCLSLICRDETTVERFIGYADEGGAGVTAIRPSPVPPDLKWLLGKCECGHTRMEHAYPLEPLWVPDNMVGWEPCRECDCMDYGRGYGMYERRETAA